MNDEGRSFVIPGNDISGFVGVDPMYMNYANETDKPRLTAKDMDALVASGEYEFLDIAVPADEVPEGAVIVEPEFVPDTENNETTIETGTNTSGADAEVEFTF